MEVEFGWVGWSCWVGVGVQTHFRVKPNSVEVVLRLSWGCDKKRERNINKGHLYFHEYTFFFTATVSILKY